MNRNKSFVLIALAVLLIAAGSIGILPIDLEDPVEVQEKVREPRKAGFWDLTGTPIVIDNNWSDTRDTYDWCTGFGTVDQPYVIENVTIDGMQKSNCITITNTNEYFEIRNCTIYNTTSDWSSIYQEGIYIEYVDNGKILDCYFTQHNYTCIGIGFGSDIVIEDNTIENYGFLGVITEMSDNITINSNNLTNGGYGVYVCVVFDCDITNNRITNSYNGIRLQHYVVDNLDNHTNYIAHNFLKNITYSAIEISYMNNNTVYDNEISQCYGTAIHSRARDNKIIKNTITNSSKGIEVGRSGNLIYLNYIETTGYNVEGYQSITNYWDNGSIGNYYSHYDGKDANDDGIGDTPYNITGTKGNEQDSFPIWWDAPAISIITPNASDTFEHIPSFEISIDEGIEDAKWYTIDDGTTNFTITDVNDTINDTAWEAASNGLIRMVVYANDSRGYIGSAEVQFTRSVNPPDIEFTVPTFNQEFRVNPPSFTVTIDDLSPIVGRWYTIDGGANYYNFTGLTDTVNNDAWNSTSEGTVILIVYVMDDLGNIGSKSITIMKNISSGPEPDPDPDPDPTPSTEQAISGYNTYIIFGIVITISVIFIKKKRAG